MARLMLLFFGLVAVSARVVDQQAREESPTVKISQGSVRGTTGSTADGTKYYKFLGIPYAKPPVGKLRFAAPQEAEPWSGIKDATKFGPMCFQLRGGSEDCLFVNVFTPKLPTSGSNTPLLPVMYYIHGGAFVGRSGNIDPAQLLNYGVVVVTINYRLNVFGFLSVNGTDAPGNAGLKDQTAGLQWVQKNIAKFGGNPNNVTLFGTSAGGASVHYHVLSPLSKGLFHRAISESGSALNPWAYTKNTEVCAYRLVGRLRKKANTSAEVVEILRAANASDLVKYLGMLLTSQEKQKLLANPFVPSLEFARKGEAPFLTHEPSYIESHGLFNKVPYITGCGSREGSSFVTSSKLALDSYWEAINKDFEQVVPLDLGLARGSKESKEVAQKVKTFYYGNKSISYETREQWIALQTDLLIAYGVVKTVHNHARHSASHTYSYQFVYNGGGHCGEYKYLVYDGKMQGNSSDPVKLARQLGSYWTSFSKTGVPSMEGAVTWKPATQQGSYPYLEFDFPLVLKYNMDESRMAFWDKIYNEYKNTTEV